MRRFWRKVHLYSFGYFKWLSLFIALLMIIISLTGILYNHHHDLKFLAGTRVPTILLPGQYKERLIQTRAVQGLATQNNNDSVPLMWLVVDLHTGDFFGPWGRLFYDLIGVMFVVLSGSGIYLYWIRKKQ